MADPMASDMRLHGYQEYCVERIIDTPCVGLFLDMGLGKTAIALHAVARLMYDMGLVRRVLVIAPKAVAASVWKQELSKWQGLAVLRCSVVLGTEAQRLGALAKEADVYVINRENTQWLVEQCWKDWPFDMVILDESSSFKNHRAKRFRALKLVRSKISRVVELTGTPNPRSLMDLWAQVYLLDKGERLGRTITAYRDHWFTPGKRNATTIFSYDPVPGAAEEIYQRISDICVSMKAADYLELPELVYNTIPVELDAAAAKAYKRLERDALLQVDEETVMATSAAVLSNKLLQLCNGACYTDEGEVAEIHDCKIRALCETIEQLNGQHALVCYNFRHDKERILRGLQTDPELRGLRVRVYAGAADADAWNSGDVDVLLIQPASCGYGLNLQRGGHHIIWFGLTWSLELYQQTNKRLHRQGQQMPVIVHHLAVVGGLDEDVMRSIDHKAEGQEALLSAIKARIREARQ